MSKVSSPLHVTFICSGNICRSPMAEKMFAHQIKERGLSDAVRVTSAGTGGWHAGDPADQRASHVLHQHGYPSAHRAAQIDGEHLSADLVVALGRNHVRMLREMGFPRTRSGCCGRSIRGRACTPSTSKTRTTAATTISKTCSP